MLGTIVAPLEIGFCVVDVERALEFWRDALGFREVSRIETATKSAIECGFALSEYVVVRLQLPTGERIKLFKPTLIEGARGDALAPPLATPGFAFATLIVEDLQDAVRQLTERGFPARRPPSELRPGVWVALVDDPDGNTVELVSYMQLSAYRPDVAAHAASGSGMHVISRCVAHPWLCDQMGHLNTRHIVGFLDDASQLFFAMLGYRQDAVLGLADVRHEIDYKAEIPMSSMLAAECGIIDMGRSSLTYLQRLVLIAERTVAVESRTKTVLFDKQRRKSMPIPEALKIVADGFRVKQ